MYELRDNDPRQLGPYQLLGRLGAGGMGVVYLGRSAGRRLIAVKVIHADLADDPRFRDRFAREVAAARKVNGLFTAAVVDADVTGQRPWLATAYVDGPSLHEAVRDHGPLPVATVWSLAAGLAEALAAIHAAGVVHRDLKPSNVLLAHDGPRVIDFGISRALGDPAITRTGTVWGTPGFSPPEQAEGGRVDPQSDIFSLGAVVAFGATGQGPFGHGLPSDLADRVVHSPPDLTYLPVELRSMVERCLAKDPRQRPTATALLRELGAAEPAPGWLPAPLASTAPAEQWPSTRAPGEQWSSTGPGEQLSPPAPLAPPAPSAGAGIRKSVALTPRTLGRSKPYVPAAVSIIPAPHQSVAPGAIVFARADPEPGIYIVYEDGTAALLAPRGTMPDLSPQGDWISYVRDAREIWLTHPNGSGREMIAKLAEPGFKMAAAPRWSPDGKHLAFELIEAKGKWLHSSSYQSYSNIYLVDVRTGEFNRFTEGTNIENYARGPVTWTATGNMVVMRDDKLYLLKGRNAELLYKRDEQPPANNVVPWPPGPPKYKDPARSPSGLIIFAQDHKGFHELHDYAVGCISRRRFYGGNQRKDFLIEDLPHPVSTPRILADDLTVVYASGDAIYRVKADPKGLFSMHRNTQAREKEPPARLVDNASDPVPVLHHWPR